MSIYIKRLAAASAAAVLISCISGCADDSTADETAEVTTTLPSAAVQSVSILSPDEIENVGPGHDIDPIGAEMGTAGLPYFTSDELEEVSFYPNENAVKREGRYIEYNDAFYLSYTCSAVSFIMTGDHIEADINSNGGVYSDKQQCYIGVVIDGKLTKRIKLEHGDATYELYDGEMLEDAEVRVVKLTENQMATCGLKRFTVNAKKIAPAQKKELKIEFIGDSICCGYGNEADGPDDHYNSAHQNGLGTYCAMTAKNLDADYDITAVSGIGLISDYTDYVGVKEDYLLLNDIYEYSDANFEMRRGMSERTHWNFRGGSDVVVINIGTNDNSYTGSNEELRDDFKDAYYDFLGVVRRNNPNAYIICTMGIMGAQLMPMIELAAADFSADNDDDRIFTMKFDYQNEDNGYGGDSHPTVASHQDAADQLTAYLKSLLAL